MVGALRNLSIRVKLALVYSAVVCITLVVLSISVYRTVVNNLNAEIDRDLRDRAVEVSAYISTRKSFTEQDIRELALLLGGVQPIQSGSNLGSTDGREVLNRRKNLEAALTFVQISDPEGKLLQAVPEIKLMTEYDSQQILSGFIRSPGEFRTFQLPNTREPVRVYTEPVLQRGNLVGYVQSARSVREIQAIADSLLWPFVIGGGAAVVALVVFGWWVTRRAFTPIENITSAAYRIGVKKDMTERIQVDPDSNDEVSRLGRAFNGMLDHIEREFVSQRQFIADSSHELRTPLTVIRGNLDLLRRNPDPKNQADSLQAIEREAARMQRLVEDLLLLAKADARQVVEFVPVMLDDVIIEVFRVAQVLAQARHQTLKLGHFEAIQVEGDAEQLKRAILNLVENAIKYTPEGGSITISMQRGNRWAKVAITDTGVGIDPIHQPHIFGRFYRIDKARSRASGGTGLGLAIVKHIAEAHGGRISLNSMPGQGSTFTLWLPISAELPTDEPEEDFSDTPQDTEDETPPRPVGTRPESHF
jgi:heavy metal sensor kinase